MTYRFPLQKVLDLKEKEKQQAQQELGVSLKKQLDEQEEMVRLNKRLETVQESINQRISGVKAAELHEHQRYLEYLNQQIRQLQGRLVLTNKEVDKKQHFLMEKSKDEKIWQEWKQKLVIEYEQTQLKQERDMLDEMANIRYFRQQNMM